MYEIQDGLRTIRFEGELLSSSTSRTEKPRWIEFRLYKTKGGSYLLARTGMSLTYHHSACKIVERNGILPVPSENVSINMVPCRDCRPNRKTDLELYPETPRHWAQRFDPEVGAVGLVDSLKREDEFGAEYITNVAKKLLIEAAKNDDEIHAAFFNEWVD